MSHKPFNAPKSHDPNVVVSQASLGADNLQDPASTLHNNDPTMPEEHDSIWILTISPAVWSAHLMVSYIASAVYCAKFNEIATFNDLRTMVTVLTIAALAVIAWVGAAGYRRHRLPDQSESLGFDAPTTRHRFLGFATFLLSLLSGVATMFTALVFIFMETCDR